MEGIINLLRSRKAQKHFEGPAEDWQVDKVIEAVRLSPSSFNIQPWRIVVIKGGDREKLSQISFNQPQIKEASHILCFLTVVDRDILLENSGSSVRRWIEGMSEKELECWAEKQTYIALGIALVQAEALGLGACPMEGFDREKWEKEIEVPKGMKLSVIMALGKKDKKSEEKIRLDNIVVKRI